MMSMIRKLLFLILIVSVVAFGFGCCKGTCQSANGEHPSAEHPANQSAPHDHPVSKHQASEHPDGDSK